MDDVTPSDRPKSVHNRCVIEVFGDVLVLSRGVLDFPVGERAFIIGLSQISSFFSLYDHVKHESCRKVSWLQMLHLSEKNIFESFIENKFRTACGYNDKHLFLI